MKKLNKSLIVLIYILALALLLYLSSELFCSHKNNMVQFLGLYQPDNGYAKAIFWLITSLLIMTISISCISLWYKLKRLSKYSNYLALLISVIGIIIPFIIGNSLSWPISLLITCILLLISVIIVLLERSKESYHFYDNYQKIENEYEHLEGEKKLVQCYIEKSLNNIRINISKFNTHFLQSLIDDNKYLTKKKSENIEEFFQCNFKNAHDYVFLSNHSEIVNDEIFSDIFYNVYKKISKRFLSPLVFETNTKVPEFISRELDNAILNINGVLCQKNASLFSLKSFYKLNGTEMAKSKRVNDYESQRLFIYKSDNADFEVETNEVDFKPPTGLNQATKVMNIPIFLWLLEWHEQNGIKVRFISEEEAKKKQYSANDINTLDFSITHIKKPNNKFIDIVLQINDIPHKEAFYNMDINYYSMTAFTTKEYENDTGECQDASHYNFFNKLWEQAESINGTIREKFFAGKFYSNLDNDKKTAIKDIIDRIYPVIS